MGKIKSKSKATHVFEVRMWSSRYYKEPKKAKHETHIYNGLVINKKETKKKYHFHSAGDLLKILENLYFAEEKKK